MKEVGSDVWGKAIVDQNDWPCGKVPLVENGKAVKRQAESNIVWVLEVFVIIGLAIHPNKLLAEIVVEFPIEGVGYCVGLLVSGMGCSIVQQLYDVFVEKHCLKLRSSG